MPDATGETEKHSPEQLPSGPPGSDPPGAEWDVLAELDRLRGANAGLSAGQATIADWRRLRARR